jgi:hypothetical protein
VYEGYDGIMQWRAEVGETWDSYRSEAEAFFEGPEAVVVFTREHGRGKGSGIEVQQRPTALLCRLRTDRVSEIRLYHDRQRACETPASRRRRHPHSPRPWTDA